MVCWYLRVCPTQGRSLAQLSLPLRPSLDDADSLALAEALAGMGLTQEAAAVQVQAGRRWIHRSLLLAGSSTLTAAASAADEVGGSHVLSPRVFLGLSTPLSTPALLSSPPPSLSASGAAVKAVVFFLAAGDFDRAYAVFDSAWTACVAALYALAQLAALHSPKEGEPGRERDGEAEIYPFEMFSGLHFASSDRCALLNGFGAESEDSISSIVQLIVNAVRTSTSSSFSSDIYARHPFRECVYAQDVLIQTLINAKLLFDAIISHEKLVALNMEGGVAAAGNVGVCLMRYVEAIELLLHTARVLETQREHKREDQRTEDTQALVLGPLYKAWLLASSLLSRHTRSRGGEEAAGRYRGQLYSAQAPMR